MSYNIIGREKEISKLENMTFPALIATEKTVTPRYALGAGTF